MHQEEDAIASLCDVDFHDGDALCEGVLQRLKGVFGIANGRAATVGGDQHAA